MRRDMRISRYTMSAWTPFLRDSSPYLNEHYRPQSSNQILQINASSLNIRLWKNYYFRYRVGYRPSLASYEDDEDDDNVF
jgi:hypothetical protein